MERKDTVPTATASQDGHDHTHDHDHDHDDPAILERFHSSTEMQALTLQLQVHLYTKDADGIVDCMGKTNYCADDWMQTMDVYRDQNAVVVEELEQALKQARQKWVLEMDQAVRRVKSRLGLKEPLTPGFVFTGEGMALVLKRNGPTRTAMR